VSAGVEVLFEAVLMSSERYWKGIVPGRDCSRSGTSGRIDGSSDHSNGPSHPVEAQGSTQFIHLAYGINDPPYAAPSHFPKRTHDHRSGIRTSGASGRCRSCADCKRAACGTACRKSHTRASGLPHPYDPRTPSRSRTRLCMFRTRTWWVATTGSDSGDEEIVEILIVPSGSANVSDVF
jgi:hypothetical protein